MWRFFSLNSFRLHALLNKVRKNRWLKKKVGWTKKNCPSQVANHISCQLNTVHNGTNTFCYQIFLFKLSNNSFNYKYCLINNNAVDHPQPLMLLIQKNFFIKIFGREWKTNFKKNSHALQDVFMSTRDARGPPKTWYSEAQKPYNNNYTSSFFFRLEKKYHLLKNSFNIANISYEEFVSENWIRLSGSQRLSLLSVII